MGARTLGLLLPLLLLLEPARQSSPADEDALRAARDSPRNRARRDGPGHVAFVDVALAHRTRVVRRPGVLSADDVARVLDVTRRVQDGCEDQSVFNNPQNAQHAQAQKTCTFLQPSGDLDDPFSELAPEVLRKLLNFADAAWREEGWSRSGGALAALAAPPAPMCDMFCEGGVVSLQVRIIEHWEYSVGGHLSDPKHYDGGSILTIVVALNSGFDGGLFTTNELIQLSAEQVEAPTAGSSSGGAKEAAGGNGRGEGEYQLEHPLSVGDGVVFVSHKYHSIQPVLSGVRRSLVIELWDEDAKLYT